MSDNGETVNILRQVVALLQRGANTSQNLNESLNATTQNQTQLPSGPTQNFTPPTTLSVNEAQAPSTSNTSQAVVSEHRRLFSRQSRIQPYSRQRFTGRRRAPKKDKTITRTMFCFADKVADEAPSSSLKIQLLQNGLGEKRVSFPVSGTAIDVKDLLYKAYPQLCNTGGFQLLVSDANVRKKLKVISHGSCTTEQMRCFGSGRIYIRPLQRSIQTVDVKVDEEFVECLTCKNPFAVSEMRRHQETCEGYQSSDDDDDELPPGLQEEGKSITTVIHVIDEEPDNSGTSTTGISNADTETVSADAGSEATIDGSDSSNVNSAQGEIPYVYEEHLRKAIKLTLAETSIDDEPVKVLRTFVCHLMRGRQLDLTEPNQTIEGETSEIFISRSNVFNDGMDELLGGMEHDPSLSLEVTFTGEGAEDLGGPRKEFLGAMLREIKDRLFVADSDDSTFTLRYDVVAENSRHYYGAGLIFGYSMLQGGPLPCFMNEGLLNKLFVHSTVELTNAEAQLHAGLSKFGLVELLKKRYCLMYLLRRTACSPLTYPKMVKLLNATFSETGSNQRIQEDRSYRLFLNYLKEVAAGRRECVSLGGVLKFVTCSENEPILGFAIHPSIIFSENLSSCLPKSNTCINRLILAIGDVLPESKDEMFERFDLAFANDYFGLI